MSEFVEIGKQVVRVCDIKRLIPVDDSQRTVVVFENGSDTFKEPYESVRDKLMGKPQKAVDRRAEFADRLISYLNGKGLFGHAAIVSEFYHSTMLSETEGAG